MSNLAIKSIIRSFFPGRRYRNIAQLRSQLPSPEAECIVTFAKVIAADKQYLYCFSGSMLSKVSALDQKKIWTARIPNLRVIDRHSRFMRIIGRPLRGGIEGGAAGESTVFFWSRRHLYLVDKNCGEVLKIVELKGRGRPLSALPTLENDKDTFFFGEYYSNPNKHPVKIFSASEDGLRCHATFEAGAINHVHNILEWTGGRKIIFTGDFDGAAGFWILHDGRLKKISLATQEYRACCGFIEGNKLFYSTDSTSIPNKFRCFDLANLKSQDLGLLPAPSIYSCPCHEGIIFSTNLEPDLATKASFFKKWLSTSLPSVIHAREVHLFIASPKGIRKLLTFEPSSLPYRLFRYPTVVPKFAAGRLAIYCESICGLSGYTIVVAGVYE